MSRPRILIMTIGLGTEQGFAEGIRRAVAETRPRRIVFVCTEASRQESIAPADIDIQHELELIPDEEKSDLEPLIARMNRLLVRLAASDRNADLHIDFTGGTKPMSAAAVLAAMANDIPFASYIESRRAPEDPRRILGSGTVQVIGLDAIRFENRFRRLTELFAKGEFVACTLDCKAMARSKDLDPGQQERLSTLRTLSDAHAAWERFQWTTASEHLGRPDDATIDRTGWNRAEIARLRAHLTACREDEGVTLARAADILANATRRLEEHRHDDAVARLYRLIEYLLQRRMRLLLGDDASLDPGNPTKGLTRDRVRRLAPIWSAIDRSMKGDDDAAIVMLGLQATAAVLAEAGDPLGRTIDEQHGPPEQPNRLGTLLQARNQSFLAHGSTPIDGRRSRELAASCRGFLALAAELEEIDPSALLDAAHPVPPPMFPDTTEARAR